MIAPLELTRIAAGSLVAAAWEGIVLAGVVAICLRMLPRITAAARSAVWTVVMLAVCGLPFVPIGGTGTGTAGSQVHLDERLGLGLVAVWALISLVRAAQLVRSAVWLRGISRRALPVGADDQYGDSGFARMTTVGGMTSRLGRAAELCVSEEVDRPCVVGFFRPRVLVPTALFEELSDSELAQIVMHEMEHLRRRDDWTNLLQKLSLVVFPLNPALIWIERQLCVERELACDDRVLKTTGARKAYAACLANLAEHSLVRRGVSLALGAWERQSEVVRRVHRILAGSPDEMGPRRIMGVVAVLMLGVVGAADGLAHAPALVSFGPAASVATRHNIGSVSGVRVEDVVYRPGALPQGLKPGSAGGKNVGTEVPTLQGDGAVRATMVKAVIPVQGSVVKATRRVSKPTIDAVKLASTESPKPGYPDDGDSMVVMVRWTTMAPVIVQDSQFVYAAVPTRNGWLFVQL